MPVTTNIDAIINNLEAKLNDGTKRYISLEIAKSLLGPVKERIHGEGLAADGTQIGTYDNAYLKIRRKFNATESTKIILALTRQMQGDFTVQAVDDTTFGLGYNNETNYEKALYNDNRFGHTIFALTTAEREKMNEVAKLLLLDAITK